MYPSLLTYEVYSSGGRERCATTINVSTASITVQGAIIDTTIEVPEGWSDWEEAEDSHWKNLLLRDKKQRNHVNGTPLLQAFFRTLFADTNPTRDKQRMLPALQDFEVGPTSGLTAGGLLVNFLTKYRASSSSLQSPTEIEDDQQLPAELVAGAEEHEATMGGVFLETDNPTLGWWRLWATNACQCRTQFPVFRSLGRGFFTTEEDYMGTRPPYARSGDKVCIIQGANVPFLLRPSPDKDKDGYLLVGEAFVSGLMDGKYDGDFEEIFIC